jgi:hypothetical protein
MAKLAIPLKHTRVHRLSSDFNHIFCKKKTVSHLTLKNEIFKYLLKFYNVESLDTLVIVSRYGTVYNLHKSCAFGQNRHRRRVTAIK